MSAGGLRDELIKLINSIFGPTQVGATARRVRRMGPKADIFEILFQLGAFPWVRGRSVDKYRRSLPIPAVNREILTAAFRTALYADSKPVPLHFEIYSARSEAVEVTMSAKRIDVVLLRVDPPGERRPRPRAPSRPPSRARPRAQR